MRKYAIASTKKAFEGTLMFEYDEEGVLLYYQNDSTMTTDQIKFLHQRFPFIEDDLLKISPAIKVEEITDVTFDCFWTKYDKKVNRKRTEILWYKLSIADRQVCLSKINKYKNYCRLNNRLMKDPDTYIRNRSWVDELT